MQPRCVQPRALFGRQRGLVPTMFIPCPGLGRLLQASFAARPVAYHGAAVSYICSWHSFAAGASLPQPSSLRTRSQLLAPPSSSSLRPRYRLPTGRARACAHSTPTMHTAHRSRPVVLLPAGRSRAARIRDESRVPPICDALSHAWCCAPHVPQDSVCTQQAPGSVT